jgi:protein SCO1/2
MKPTVGKLSCFAIFVLLCTVISARAVTDAVLKQVAFDQKLGAQISLNLSFRDEDGKSVKLAEYFGKNPVILDLGYYKCPMLCTAVLNGMMLGLQDMDLQMGRDFEVINISIDPSETPDLAAAKKTSYLTRYGHAQAAAHWHFLTGNEPEIRKLAAEVGFKYVYDPEIRQYAHPSGIIVLTPDGKVSHYLFGVVFGGRDLKDALTDAKDAKVGSPIQQLFLLCFHYSPLTGKYSGAIMTVVRLLSVGVLLSLVVLIARKA